MNIQAIVYSAFMYQPLERLLYATRAGPGTKTFFRQTRKVLKSAQVSCTAPLVDANLDQPPFGS